MGARVNRKQRKKTNAESNGGKEILHVTGTKAESNVKGLRESRGTLPRLEGPAEENPWILQPFRVLLVLHVRDVGRGRRTLFHWLMGRWTQRPWSF